MLVEKLKEFNENLSWKFNYGADQWQNLQDFEDDSDLDFDDRAKYFLLLWKDRTYDINDFGAIEGYSFEGEFVLCVRSKFDDPDYNFKYEDHIAALEKEVIKVFDGFSFCEGWTVKSWREVEVSNQYDTNIDGLKVRFVIEYKYDK